MGRTKDSGLSAASNSPLRKELSNKTDALAFAQKPFDANKFDYESSKSKYESYLLNLKHVDGGSKAKFLKETLGYTHADGKILHQNLQQALEGKRPSKIENTKYGIKANFKIQIKGNNGKFEYANVTAVLQQDNGKTNWRIITITPSKKK